jgi:predicted GNAT family N-acyltransferase
MKLVPLNSDYELNGFDCGDEDLNHFLLDDAKPSQELRIANTFILEADNGSIAAYFCLLNDKVSKDEVIGSHWKKIRSNFPKDKQFRSYPSIKIGRFAVSKDFRGRNIGSDMMDMLIKKLHTERSHSAFHYITVDAYISAIPFYEKNGFVHLTKKDENEHTRLMYYDMMELA